MSVEIFNLLAKYNGTVNEKMNRIISSLSDDEWNREFGGFFKSVRSLASHIFIADFSWLKRMLALREFKTASSTIFSHSYSFKDTLFPGVKDYLDIRPVLDKEIVNFVGELTAADLEKLLKYSDFRGNSNEKVFHGALLQMLNHATHHRGMISLYLELLGKDNDFSSVIAVI